MTATTWAAQLRACALVQLPTWPSSEVERVFGLDQVLDLYQDGYAPERAYYKIFASVLRERYAVVAAAAARAS